MRQKVAAVLLYLAAAACAGLAFATYQDNRAKAEARAERITAQERAEASANVPACPTVIWHGGFVESIPCP